MMTLFHQVSFQTGGIDLNKAFFLYTLFIFDICYDFFELLYCSLVFLNWILFKARCLNSLKPSIFTSFCFHGLQVVHKILVFPLSAIIFHALFNGFNTINYCDIYILDFFVFLNLFNVFFAREVIFVKRILLIHKFLFIIFRHVCNLSGIDARHIQKKLSHFFVKFRFTIISEDLF